MVFEYYFLDNGYAYDNSAGNNIAKSMASTSGWNTSANTGAVGNDQSSNNSSGFNAFPEGKRGQCVGSQTDVDYYCDGLFRYEGTNTYFWSAYTSGLYWEITYWYDILLRYGTNSLTYGYSVRLIKD